MLKNSQKLLMAGAMVLIGATAVVADDDIELRINGDFRGTSIGAPDAPGWKADALAGSTRIVQGDEWDEFAIDISAPRENAKSVCSEFFPVSGNILKLKTMIQGNGTAYIGFQAFGADKQQLEESGMTTSYQASMSWAKTRNYFSITDPRVKFIKVCLTAEPGSTVRFADIDAEFYSRATATPPRDFDRMIVAQQPHQAAQAAAPAQATPAVQTAVPAAAPSPAMAVLPLINDKFYSLKSIGNAEYQVTLPVGSEIEFKLEEDADNGSYWVIHSYDAMVCRVKMEHDRDGIWPFRYDNAEIELKAMSPGSSRIVFTNPEKSFTVLMTVK